MVSRRVVSLLSFAVGLALTLSYAASEGDRSFSTAGAPRQVTTAPDPSRDLVYVCPMDPDVRSHAPGVCPRCGMKLTGNIPDPVEFHLDLTVTPEPPQAGQPASLEFVVHDPWKDRTVKNFIVIHEKLFHAFVVSQDLEFFMHGHPMQTADGAFHYPIVFPKAGMFRILGDFYPDGATPQLIAKTIVVPGTPPSPVTLDRDYSTKTGENLRASFATIPTQPVAGGRTQMRFTIDPGDGFEKYLGAWSHMLAASDDLIDLMHRHPFLADGGPQVEFEVNFPRARVYRVWVQFQRRGVLNTVHFDVPVKQQEEAALAATAK